MGLPGVVLDKKGAIQVSGLSFETGGAKLKDESSQTIRKVAYSLVSRKGLIYIDGHTDSVPVKNPETLTITGAPCSYRGLSGCWICTAMRPTPSDSMNVMPRLGSNPGWPTPLDHGRSTRHITVNQNRRTTRLSSSRAIGCTSACPYLRVP